MVSSSSTSTIKSSKRGRHSSHEAAPPPKRLSLADKFNTLGMGWINLQTMEKNHPYRILKMQKTTTQFGKRIQLNLEDDEKMYLPERYTCFTEKQLAEMGAGNYTITNHGIIKGGKMYNLTVSKVNLKRVATPPPPPPPPLPRMNRNLLDEAIAALNDDSLGQYFESQQI